MSNLNFRKKIFIVLIVSILFRLGFLVFGDIIPVMWDARRYVGASIGLISYVDSSGDVTFQTENQDRERFKHYTDKYIQGEQIEWLKYKPFTLTEARNEIFIGGPLYPIACGLLMTLSPVNDFFVLRLFNIFLDLLANLMVLLIAVRLIGKKGAIVAGFLYALYFPFTLLTSMILLESSTTLLMLVAIYYMIKGVEENQNKFIFFAGLVSGLLLLNKPTALLLVFPFIASFVWYAKSEMSYRAMIPKLVKFFIPFAIIGLCWMSIASFKYGELTLRDPSYKEANLRSSSNITYEGYDLDKVEKDFWEYSIADHISNDKLGYVGLLAKKFERMWSKSSNDFKKTYLLSANGWERVHLFLVFSGLIGLVLLSVNNSRASVWILMIAMYYSSIHIIFHSVSRYSFNVLPLLFIASSYFFVQLYEFLKSKNQQRKKLYYALGGLLFVYLWEFEFLNSILQIQLTELTIIVTMMLLIVICFYALFIISKIFIEKKSQLHILLLPIVSSLILICGFYSTVLSRSEWSEFSCRLDDPTLKVGSRIYIDKENLKNESGMYAVILDVNSGAGRENSFTVSIGGVEQEFVGGKPPLRDLFYPKPTYRFYSTYIPLAIEEFRQYAIIPVAFEQLSQLLDSNGYIDVSIAINDKFNEENNFINLYGNFETGEAEHFIPAIRFTSVERYVHRGDPRIKYPVKYLSKNVISYYIKRNLEDVAMSTDLSPSVGRQSGRYNLFLVHFSPNGEFKVY